MAAIPHATIGCQELLATGNVSHSGFLRKQMTVRKRKNSFMGAIAKMVEKLPWVQRYVVLSEGSLYHYSSETAKSPAGCYPLQGYNQVVRAGELTHQSHPWAFKILHDRDPQKTKYFAAASETEFKKWQQAIRSELIVANGSLKRKNREMSDGDQDSVDLPVYSPPDDLSGDGSIEELDSDDEDKDDYIEIDEGLQSDSPFGGDTMSRSSMPLPPTPGGEEKKNTWHNRRRGDDNVPMILSKMSVSDNDDSPLESPPRKAQRSRAPVPLPSLSGGPRSPLSPPEGSKSPPADTAKPRPHKPLPQPPVKAKSQNLPAVSESEPEPEPKKAGPRFGVNVMGLAGPLKGPPQTLPKPTSVPARIQTTNRVVPKPPPVSKKPTKPSVAELENEAYDVVEETSPITDDPPQASVTSTRLSWKDYFWDGYDKDACQQILRNIGVEGVFMVREGNTAEHKTLVCFADGAVRKYKISTTDEGQYSIKSGWNFNSIELLLQHYLHNNLPNRETHLTSPYTKMTN